MKIAFRSLGKRPGFTFINVCGLAIGIACCLLISLYVVNELSYDEFNKKADRIYRITQTTHTPDDEKAAASTPFRVGPTLEAEFPQHIEKSVRFYDQGDEAHSFLDRSTKTSFRTSGFYFTDSTFFDVFSTTLVKGNPDEALDKPLSLVISEELAERHFPDQDPIGKSLSYHGIKSMSMTITGVMENWPDESHMDIQALASFSSLKTLFHRQPEYLENWWVNPVWTYVELNEQEAASSLENQFPGFVDKYYQGADRPEGERVELGLQRLADIHLYSNLDHEMKPNGSIFYIYLFSAVALFILLIACVNFMNLATARSAERAREVGMRKVLGAKRGQLFRQFMGESFLMSLFAMVLALLLVYLALPFFNDFFEKDLVFSAFEEPVMLLGLLVLFVSTAFIAGIYPAVFLSGFRPTAILKGEATKGKRGVLFRKALVVLQFSLSVALIIGTVLVYLQLQHMQSKELGFEKERIVILPMSQNLIAWYYDRFKEQAVRSPAISSVTGISKILGSEKEDNWKIYPADTPQGEEQSTQALHVNYDFLDTFGIDLIAGRGFSKKYQTDKDKAILINRAMLDRLGLAEPGEALGAQFRYDPGVNYAEPETFNVVGVVENFHYTSIKKKIEPLVIRLSTGTRPVLSTLNHAAVKVVPGSITEALQHLEKTWSEINFVDPFEYRFQDEELEEIYATERRVSRVAGAFTILCILVACLGLFGLASFTASRRTREIGIRKSLGASIQGIVILLSKEYVKLVVAANVVAWPIIYYLAVSWLQNFPSRISLGWNLAFVLAATAILSILICLVTVSYQSVKAALVNPAVSIRQE